MQHTVPLAGFVEVALEEADDSFVDEGSVFFFFPDIKSIRLACFLLLFDLLPVFLVVLAGIASFALFVSFLLSAAYVMTKKQAFKGLAVQ